MKVKRTKKGTRPSTQPKPTGQLLDGTFRWLKLDESAKSYRAMRAFALAAGPRISDHVRAERLRGSILYVRCESSSWTQHLHVMKSQLIERVRQTPGGEEVQEIRFNVGPLAEIAGWELPVPTVLEAAPAPHAMTAEIARALDCVDDDELRERLYRLYGKLGATKK